MQVCEDNITVKRKWDIRMWIGFGQLKIGFHEHGKVSLVFTLSGLFTDYYCAQEGSVSGVYTQFVVGMYSSEGK